MTYIPHPRGSVPLLVLRLLRQTRIRRNPPPPRTSSIPSSLRDLLYATKAGWRVSPYSRPTEETKDEEGDGPPRVRYIGNGLFQIVPLPPNPGRFRSYRKKMIYIIFAIFRLGTDTSDHTYERKGYLLSRWSKRRRMTFTVIDDSSTDSWIVYCRRVVNFSFIIIIFHSPSIFSFFRPTLLLLFSILLRSFLSFVSLILGTLF